MSPTSSKTSGRKLQNFNLGTHLPCLQNCERIENRNVLQARVLRECVYTRPACKECERLKRNDLQAGLARVDIHLPCLLSEYYIQNKRAGTRWFTSGFGSYIYFRYASASCGNACNREKLFRFRHRILRSGSSVFCGRARERLRCRRFHREAKSADS